MSIIKTAGIGALVLGGIAGASYCTGVPYHADKRMQRLAATLEAAISVTVPDISRSLVEDTGDWGTIEPTYVSDTGFDPVVPNDLERTLSIAAQYMWGDYTSAEVLAPLYANIAISYMDANQINLLFYRTLQNYEMLHCDAEYTYHRILRGICPSELPLDNSSEKDNTPSEEKDYVLLEEDNIPDDNNTENHDTGNYNTEDYNVHALLAAAPPNYYSQQQIDAIYGLFQTLDSEVQEGLLKREIFLYALKQEAVGTRNQTVVARNLVETLSDEEFQVICKPLE